MAVDKRKILDAVYLGTGANAVNPIPPTIWSWNDAVKDFPCDPDKAKQLLAAAGVSRRLRDGGLGDAGSAHL
jgi:dipeptide transport system substrate-binding protein